MNYKIKKKKRVLKTWQIFVVLFIMLVFLSISYALFSTTLIINGTASGTQQQYSVLYLNIPNSSSYPSTIGYMSTYTNVFTGTPTIQGVSMGGNALTLNTDYTYTGGTLTIPNVTGNLVIQGDTSVTYVSVTFDNDGVTNVVQVVQGNTVSKPSPDPTKSGYVFLGWVDENDVDFNFTTPITTNITLYAKWRVKTTATFNTGSNVNNAMKTLANNNLSNITYIRKSSTAPAAGVTTQTVSTSTIPIVMWYESNTIYYYSEADEMYTNATSSNMFRNLTKVKEIDIGFKTDNATTMNQMFYNCQALISLDLSSFNTSKVKDMASMFGQLKALSTLDLSSFDTSKVTTMANMFNGSSGITNLNLTSFNTTSLKTMTRMFSSMSNITVLDVSSFNTSSVTTMEKMFDNMASITTIYASSNWVTTNVTNSTNMFINDTNLVGGNGTTYDATHITKEYAVIDTASTPGYFTAKP